MSKRAVLATLAWAAATATAMGVVWTGLDAVLPVAAQGPRVAPVAAWPEQQVSTTSGLGSPEATVQPPPSPSAASADPGTPPPSPSAAGTTPASQPATHPPTTQASTTSSPAGEHRRYSTPGGTAVLTLLPDSVVLDAATPATGYSVRSWSESGLVEVEFSPADAGTVYEVIATWNGTSPQVQTVAVGG